MYTETMQLKPQDIVVLIKLLEYGDDRPTYAQIGKELFLSASEVHAAVQRAKRARLFNVNESGGRPSRLALEEFLVHGLKYAFPAERGELTRGVPTAHAAEPLKRQIAADGDPPPVWPSADGKIRGYSFAPLYKTVPHAALRDPYLYEVLALIDAIRDGRARERQLAEKELKIRLESPQHAELKH
jgi:hypothetical protein